MKMIMMEIYDDDDQKDDNDNNNNDNGDSNDRKPFKFSKYPSNLLTPHQQEKHKIMVIYKLFHVPLVSYIMLGYLYITLWLCVIHSTHVFPLIRQCISKTFYTIGTR